VSTTTKTDFCNRVHAVIGGFESTGVMDRYAANDVLLDLLDAAGTDEESARVMGALASLPKSNLVDRAELATILVGLCASQN
jgi:hypothetical protein